MAQFANDVTDDDSNDYEAISNDYNNNSNDSNHYSSDFKQIKALETNLSHKGYVSIKVEGQYMLGLVDSGNSIDFDTCIKGQLAKDLKLVVNKHKLNLGSASSNYNMHVLGTTNFTMYLEIDSKWIPFEVTSLVIKDLSDHINIGSFFLKKHGVSLKFSENKPLIISFEKFGDLESIGCLSVKTLPKTVRFSPEISHDTDTQPQLHVPEKNRV